MDLYVAISIPLRLRASPRCYAPRAGRNRVARQSFLQQTLQMSLFFDTPTDERDLLSLSGQFIRRVVRIADLGCVPNERFLNARQAQMMRIALYKKTRILSSSFSPSQTEGETEGLSVLSPTVNDMCLLSIFQARYRL